MKPFFDRGHQNVNRDGDPNLSFYGVLRSPVKRFDAQMLFDPFEKQFYFPAMAIQISDDQG